MKSLEQKNFDDPGFLHLNYHIMEFIGKIENKTFLDIGCAEGYYPYLMDMMGAVKSVGIEIDKKKVEKAKFRNIDVIERDATIFNLNEKFDCVLCSEVLEHVDNSQLIVNNVANHLKREGFAVISVPSLTTVPHRLLWWWIRPKLKKSYAEGRSNHFHPRITYVELKKMIESSGMVVEKARGLNLIYLLKPFHWLTAINNVLSYLPFSKYFGDRVVVKCRLR